MKKINPRPSQTKEIFWDNFMDYLKLKLLIQVQFFKVSCAITNPNSLNHFLYLEHWTNISPKKKLNDQQHSKIRKKNLRKPESHQIISQTHKNSKEKIFFPPINFQFPFQFSIFTSQIGNENFPLYKSQAGSSVTFEMLKS